MDVLLPPNHLPSTLLSCHTPLLQSINYIYPGIQPHLDFYLYPTISLFRPENFLSEKTKGLKTNVACNGRGSCDRSTGLCKCDTQFESSNGLGAAGFLGDCGFTAVSNVVCPGMYVHVWVWVCGWGACLCGRVCVHMYVFICFLSFL